MRSKTTINKYNDSISRLKINYEDEDVKKAFAFEDIVSNRMGGIIERRKKDCVELTCIFNKKHFFSASSVMETIKDNLIIKISNCEEFEGEGVEKRINIVDKGGCLYKLTVNTGSISPSLYNPTADFLTEIIEPLLNSRDTEFVYLLLTKPSEHIRGVVREFPFN